MLAIGRVSLCKSFWCRPPRTHEWSVKSAQICRKHKDACCRQIFAGRSKSMSAFTFVKSASKTKRVAVHGGSLQICLTKKTGSALQYRDSGRCRERVRARGKEAERTRDIVNWVYMDRRSLVRSKPSNASRVYAFKAQSLGFVMMHNFGHHQSNVTLTFVQSCKYEGHILKWMYCM